MPGRCARRAPCLLPAAGLATALTAGSAAAVADSGGTSLSATTRSGNEHSDIDFHRYTTVRDWAHGTGEGAKAIGPAGLSIERTVGCDDVRRPVRLSGAELRLRAMDLTLPQDRIRAHRARRVVECHHASGHLDPGRDAWQLQRRAPEQVVRHGAVGRR